MFDALKNGQLGLALKMMKQYVDACPDVSFSSRYESVVQDYSYMLRFLSDGYKDPEREKLHDDMIVKAYRLCQDLAKHQKILADSALLNLQKGLAGKETNAAKIIEALRDKTLDAKQHYEVLSNAFISIFLSENWREQEQRLWTAYLISSDTDVADAQVLVSAIMLGCMLGYCIEKYKTLCYVYMTAEQSLIRERALVGWVWCYKESDSSFQKDFDTQNDIVQHMLMDDSTCTAVVEMLMQVIKCTEAEKDHKTIEKEIMPDILKGNPVKFTSKDGFIEKDDSLDDILNPGEKELAMEKMEQGIQRMSNMQKAGSDIFYAGFRQMKRYPFFYKIVNWFMPFDSENPDLGDAILMDEDLKAMARLCAGPAMCNSDRYSFILAIKSIIHSLPENVREAMKEGQMKMAGMDASFDIMEEPAYIRKMYLQDLYRFFTLSPQVKMPNVFDSTSWVVAFVRNFVEMSKHSVEMSKHLLRHGKLTDAYNLLLCVDESEERCLLLAAIEQKKGGDASVYYEEALEYNPNSIPALKGLIRCCLQVGRPDAVVYCKKLCELSPGFSNDMNLCHAYIIDGMAEEHLNDIYRLDFEHPDDPKVKRLLAWALLCVGRFEKAEEMYQRLLEGKWGEVTRNDYLSVIDLYFVSGDMKKCIESCHRFMNAYPLESDGFEEKWKELYSILKAEFSQLSFYHMYNLSDISILVDAVMCP